ncbi:transcriptional regulator, TraR/DksA family [Ferrimonas balearica DSM 9799]|uniref:Transcriptional regulator, TraR/DksA family n=1 Tax=Ferrimonas balearica (strain DSM 9799 / CCM 4581 / KCTC 23876 / PAT) TaxID=550540 RepID=E1SUC9_FERBD|nr:DksA/TraR family C4-type zinc finger protein [Ferrimonas balearica]ADN76262.1 transcriptional regulator, TraR/DksA family [Ferrimonas balearica DSM 9799]
MAVGFSRDGAVNDQIDATIEDAIAQARAQQAHGTSAPFCIECDEPIPAARRRALPGVQRCVACQSQADSQQRRHSLFNRRGSKDSQLR